MKELTKAEEALLLAILQLKDIAYGVAIRRHIQKNTGKALPYGTLYFILEQLTKHRQSPTLRYTLFYPGAAD